jgi:hypothetical protein
MVIKIALDRKAEFHIYRRGKWFPWKHPPPHYRFNWAPQVLVAPLPLNAQIHCSSPLDFTHPPH